MATLRPCKEESVNFDETDNLYIEGNNLEVIKVLQKSYYNKIKMIYIDPPYNTGHDFVYNDDFKDPLDHYKEITSQTTKSNPESMGRFHTAWLNMMLPRLRLAANLLREDGVIFISIDDHEVHNLRKICDEVFGEENFVAQIVYIACHINMTITSAGSNYACIKGLPYTCRSGTDKYGLSLVEEYHAVVDGSSDPRGYVVQNTTQIHIREHSGAGAINWKVDNGQYIGYAGCYIKT